MINTLDGSLYANSLVDISRESEVQVIQCKNGVCGAT